MKYCHIFIEIILDSEQNEDILVLILCCILYQIKMFVCHYDIILKMLWIS